MSVFRRVAIQNFKAIGEKGVDLDLAPLTLLVGENGAGKSSVLEALGVFAQSVRPTMRIGLQLSGRLVQLPAGPQDHVHRRRSAATLRIEADWLPTGTRTSLGAWLEVVGEHEQRAGEWRQGLRAGDSSVTFERQGTASSYRLKATLRGQGAGVVYVQGQPDRFLDEGLFVATEGASAPVRGLHLFRVYADRLAEAFSSASLRYSSALRGGVLMESEPRGPANSAGAHGEHTIRLHSRLQRSADRPRSEWLDAATQRFGLPQLRSGYEGGGDRAAIEAEFEDPSTGARLPLLNAGFGSLQALPVLVDLADLPAGGTLLAEEIEHSCHPSWLAAWGETLADAHRSLGVQIVATTHAPDLVLAVGLAVKRGLIASDDVAVYEVRRSEVGVDATRRAFDSRGRVVGGWIQTFATAEKQLLTALLGEDEPIEPKPKPKAARRAPRRRA